MIQPGRGSLKMKGKSKAIRYTVQIGFLAFLTYLGYMHQQVGGGPGGIPPVDALCPLGGAETIYSYLKSGVWLRRTAPSALILFGSVALMTVLLGRVFCGWICPLGTIGQISASVGRKIGLKKVEIPKKLDSIMRLGKYVILAIAVLGSWYYGTLLWRGYDPWVAWMHMSAGWAEVEESPWAFAILFGTVIGASMVIERFWCRYLCPLGGLLSLLQKISFVKVRRKDQTCVHCHKCGSSCPMGLDPESKEVETSADCIACGECVESCPVQDTLIMSAFRRRLSPLVVGFVGLAIFFGVYGTAKYMGLWSTTASMPKTQENVNPADYVYGWMSLEQVSGVTGLSAEKLIEIGQLDEGIPRDKPLKSIEGVDDHIFTDDLKRWFDSDEAKLPSNAMPAPPSNIDELRGSLTLTEIGSIYGIDPSDIVKHLTEVDRWSGDIPLDIPIKDIAKPRGEEVQVIREAVKATLAKERP